MKIHLSAAPLLLLLLLILLPIQALRAGAPPEETVEAPEVIVLGDIHGDIATFRKLLASARLMDRSDRWAGGRRHLVQLGDLLDRGTGSRAVMDLLLRLEAEARAAGGAVTNLLGNHEIMNLVGDLRYTTPQEFEAFRPEERPEDRAQSRERILSLIRNGSPLLRSGYYAALGRTLGAVNFDRALPPGIFAHRRAFSPEGRYGKWLLGKKTVHLESETLFVHGGLNAYFGSRPPDEINIDVRNDLEAYFRGVAELEARGVFDGILGCEELRDLLQAERKAGGPAPEVAGAFRRLERVLNGILFGEDGPFWYRGLAEEQAPVIRRSVGAILSFHKARRIVMGHTITRSLGIESRLDGRIWLIDTGMNQDVYGGRPQALVIPPVGEPRILK